MKNKRVIIAVVVIAAVAVISGIALLFMKPVVSGRGQEQKVSEKSGADILKAASGDVKAKFGKAMSTPASVNSALNIMEKFDCSIDIEEAVINGKDYTEGKVLHYKLSDLLNDNNMSASNPEYNMGNGSGMSIDQDAVSSMLEKMDEETIEQYQKVAEKLSNYVVAAIDTVIEKSSYEKQPETIQLSIGDEKLDADAYKVIIPVSVVVSSFEKTIDDIFNDADIAPYITMLKTVGAQLDRDELKSLVREQLNMENICFTMYVKNEKLCGFYMDGTWYNKDSDDKAEYVFWNNKFGFNIYIDNYEGNSCKLKGNGKIESNL